MVFPHDIPCHKNPVRTIKATKSLRLKGKEIQNSTMTEKVHSHTWAESSARHADGCSLESSATSPNDDSAARDGATFPIVLHKMLCSMEAERKEHIISWSPDGRSFSIQQPRLFAETIMPRYFKNQTRYKSFQVRAETFR